MPAALFLRTDFTMIRISQAYVDSLLEGDWQLHDLTTEGMGIENQTGRVTAKPKTAGVVAGLEIAVRLFEAVGLKPKVLARDGDEVGAGEPILIAEGPAGALHAVYKEAQCVLEYATGIARRTRAMTDAARAVSPAVTVACTRKHFPGTKVLSAAGVLAGGGILHRVGVSDSILVFDQHRVLTDDPESAVRRLIAREPERKVAVEVDSPEEGLRWARLGVHIIQCERFAPDVLKAFVREVKAQCPGVVVNAAGGVNGENAAAYAETGADVLVTSWPYFGRPADVKMAFERV